MDEVEIVDLDLLRNPRSLKTIGNSIYGSVIIDGSPNELGKELCCVKEGTCDYSGEASEWVPYVLSNDGKGNANFVTIKDRTYVVKSVSTLDRFSSFKDKDIFNLESLRRSMVRNSEVSTKCLGVLGDFKYKYIGLDTFGAEIINGANVNRAFESEGSMPKTYNKIVSYSLCGRAGLMLMEQADKTDLAYFLANLSKDDTEIYEVSMGKKKSTFSGVKRAVILPVIKQVVSTIDFLQKKIEFIHSELLSNNVLISSNNVKAKYGPVKLDGKYLAKIADYSHASSSLELDGSEDKVRFFNEYRVTRFLPITPSFDLNPKKEQVCQVNIGSGSLCKDVLWWELPSTFGLKTSLITQHSGMPFYRSYDFYTFMVSLMLCPKFYYMIMSSDNADLYAAIWLPLWKHSELDRVNKLVEKNKGEKISLSLVLDIMAGLSLRCDAIEVVLDNLTRL